MVWGDTGWGSFGNDPAAMQLGVGSKGCSEGWGMSGGKQ